MGLVGMLGLFICILLHELGHALVAKIYKVPTAQITLFIFGGIAEIKKEPPTPRAEFFIAIAGPIVSLFLSGLFYLLIGGPPFIHGVLSYLAAVNAVIAVFNMIPAFPLDGGRVLRALLWGWKNNYAWATTIATRLGWGFGLALIILGLVSFIFGNFLAGLWLVIIGLFLQGAATSSQTQLTVGRALKNEKVQSFMKRDPESVSPDLTIAQFVEHHVYQSHHHLYPVTDNHRLLGYITLHEVKTLSPSQWPHKTVQELMLPLLQTITPQTNALEALNFMRESNQPTLLVVDGQKLVGLLTAQDLFKQIALKIDLEDSKK